MFVLYLLSLRGVAPAAAVVQAERRVRCATSCTVLFSSRVAGHRARDAAAVLYTTYRPCVEPKQLLDTRCLTTPSRTDLRTSSNNRVVVLCNVATAVVSSEADNACQTPGARRKVDTRLYEGGEVDMVVLARQASITR